MFIQHANSHMYVYLDHSCWHGKVLCSWKWLCNDNGEQLASKCAFTLILCAFEIFWVICIISIIVNMSVKLCLWCNWIIQKWCISGLINSTETILCLDCSRGEVCAIEPLHMNYTIKDHPMQDVMLVAMATLSKVSFLSALWRFCLWNDFIWHFLIAMWI